MRLSRRSFLTALSTLPLACQRGAQEMVPVGNATPTGIVFGRDRFVAAGWYFRPGRGDGGGVIVERSAGAAWVSADGRSFQPVPLPIAASAVAFGGDRFVAVMADDHLGPDGVLQTLAGAAVSADGLSWRQTEVPAAFGSIAFGNDRFIAVGPNGVAGSSADGETWQLSALPIDQPRRVLFGAGRFVAYGEGEVIASSDDGVSWQAQRLLGNPPISTITGVAFAHGAFLGSTVHRGGEEETDPPVGRLASQDGVSWTVSLPGSRPWPPPFLAGVERSGRLIAIRDGELATSDDGGERWTQRLRLDGLVAIAAGPAGVVAVGPAGGSGALVISLDGEQWTTAPARLPTAELGDAATGLGPG
jgi:hypothetical protein